MNWRVVGIAAAGVALVGVGILIGFAIEDGHGGQERATTKASTQNQKAATLIAAQSSRAGNSEIPVKSPLLTDLDLSGQQITVELDCRKEVKVVIRRPERGSAIAAAESACEDERGRASLSLGEATARRVRDGVPLTVELQEGDRSVRSTLPLTRATRPQPRGVRPESREPARRAVIVIPGAHSLKFWAHCSSGRLPNGQVWRQVALAEPNLSSPPSGWRGSIAWWRSLLYFGGGGTSEGEWRQTTVPRLHESRGQFWNVHRPGTVYPAWQLYPETGAHAPINVSVAGPERVLSSNGWFGCHFPY